MENEIIHGDCIEVMKELPQDSIDLVIIDPPYNINKAEWDKINNYFEWFGEVILEIERVLKPKGSFYFFHNQFLTIVEIQQWINNNSKFIFKQLLVWDKWHNPIKKGNNLQGAFFKIVHNPILRNYPKMCEYILFYTFQDETTIDKTGKSIFAPIRDYLREERNKSKLSMEDINEILVNKRKSDLIGIRYFAMNQWAFPTKEMYGKLQTTGFFQKPYNDLLNEYEYLKYIFNQNSNETSILQYPIPNIEEKEEHETPKPLELVKTLILHSSNEGDMVLDCFGGSGTVAQACKETNRKYILIEKEEKYIEIIKKRLSQQSLQFATVDKSEPKWEWEKKCKCGHVKGHHIHPPDSHLGDCFSCNCKEFIFVDLCETCGIGIEKGEKLCGGCKDYLKADLDAQGDKNG